MNWKIITNRLFKTLKEKSFFLKNRLIYYQKFLAKTMAKQLKYILMCEIKAKKCYKLAIQNRMTKPSLVTQNWVDKDDLISPIY